MVLVESALVGIATKSQAVSYSEVASVTLLTWDVLITASDEVNLIWMKQWTSAKGLYVVVRYLPWSFQLALLAINTNGTTGLRFTTAQCRKWMIFQAIILQLVVTTVDIVLVMRVYALYNKSRTLLISLSVVLAAEIAYLSHNLATTTPKLEFSDDCFVTSSPPLFVVYWIVSLAFETLLFGLTLLKFAMALKDGWGRRPVMRDFVSDGTWAYALIFVTMLVNSALYKTVHSPLAGICFTWLLTVLSFAGSRLILNPRRRNANRGTGEGTSNDNNIQLISIPLTPLTFSPLSPHSRRSSALPSPSSRKSGYSFGGKSQRAYFGGGQRRQSAWTVSSPTSPTQHSIHIHVRQETSRLSCESSAPAEVMARSEIGLAV